MSKFVIFGYYLPIFLSVVLVPWFWSIIRNDHVWRVKELIGAGLLYSVVTLVPLFNFMPVGTAIAIELDRIFNDDESDTWWNKKVS